MANELTKLMIDTARGCVANYSTGDANAAIRAQFNKVLGVDENSTPREIRKATQAHKLEVFNIIEETVNEMLISGWGDNPFFRQLVDQRNLSLGDRNEFYIPDNSILTVSEFSGNHHDLMRQKLVTGTSKVIPTSWYGIKVFEDFERFRAGRIDWAEYIDAIYKALDQKVNDMLNASFMGLKDAAPASFTVTGTGDLEAIMNVIEKVETATGADVMLCGPRAALTKLSALSKADWSDDMKTERNTTGQLGVWEGVPLVRIPQVFAPGTRDFKYAQDLLYVLPMVDNKPIKLVYEGDPIFEENTESSKNRDMTIEAEYQVKMGVATVVGADYGVIDIVQ